MADVKGSLLPSDGSPTTDDYMITVDGGGAGTKKITLAQLATLISANLTAGAVTLSKMDLTTFASVTAYLIAAQNTTNGISLVNLDTEEHDQGSNFNTTTHLFTAPSTGKYLICESCYVATSGGRTTPAIYKNGSAFIELGTMGATGFNSIGEAIVLSLTAGDTIGLGIRADGVYAINHAWIATDISTYMSVTRIA